MKKIFISIAIIFILTSPIFAWTITKELEKELKVKTAALKQNDPDSTFDLAITYAYTNKIQEGWGLLSNIEKMDPTYKNKAYRTYIQKVNQNPSDWRLRFRLGFAYYFAGKKELAINELKNVLIIDPYNVWAYGYIGLIYGEMNNIDPAIQYIKAGLKIDNLVAALHLLLSQAYYKKGDSWGGFVEASTAIRLKLQGY